MDLASLRCWAHLPLKTCRCRLNLCNYREYPADSYKLPPGYIPGEYQRSLAAAFILPSLVLGGFLAFAVYKIARIRLAPPVIGIIIGEEAKALERLALKGYVSFQGEYWKAEAEEIVEKGEKVVIMGKDGAVLKVQRIHIS